MIEVCFCVCTIYIANKSSRIVVWNKTTIEAAWEEVNGTWYGTTYESTYIWKMCANSLSPYTSLNMAINELHIWCTSCYERANTKSVVSSQWIDYKYISNDKYIIEHSNIRIKCT